jgi:hypothetical protein
MYPASDWSILLRATMDISAHAFSLADRPQRGRSGHQCSHAPGRPILHLYLSLSQTSAGKLSYVIDSSSSFALSCSFVRAWRPFLRPDLRGHGRAARRGGQGWPSHRPCLLLPCYALYEVFEVKRYFTAFFIFFITVSLFDLESRFFAPTHTCWKPTRAGVRASRRSVLTSARSFPGRALTAPSTSARLLGSG